MTQDRIGLCGPIPDNGGVAGYTASIVGRVVEKLAGLVIVVACCWWAASVGRSRAADNWLIWGAPLAVFPVSYAGRKALDARPTAAHASRMDIAVHYAVGAALGMGIFPAFRRLLAEPVIQTPWLRQAAGALVVVTGAAAALTVVNLAWRGMGAPFAVKLSSRLATDGMYGWTRNPMGLCSVCWFASMGLERGSVWFLVWLATSVSPGWIFFAKVYEERELELRFGQSYVEYRQRTPMFLPRKPRESAR
jgi:protein-S-isoprenylcysteine O-methyltransferase Ste14